VTAVHGEGYVEAVRSTSASRGSLDDETVLSPGSYRAALHAAGGACAMVDALLAGEAAATLEALAGDEPPEMVAPDFLTTRAASYIGHYWTL
jgi:acetoin utilization deacetylase AcuC-like enzyme